MYFKFGSLVFESMNYSKLKIQGKIILLSKIAAVRAFVKTAKTEHILPASLACLGPGHWDMTRTKMEQDETMQYGGAPK